MKLTIKWTPIFLFTILIIVFPVIFGIAVADVSNPCCIITAIDNTTGIVTATETATGKIFEFKQLIPGISPVIGLQAPGAVAFINSLKVGQGINADFTAGKVTVSGTQPCCIIVGRPNQKGPN